MERPALRGVCLNRDTRPAGAAGRRRGCPQSFDVEPAPDALMRSPPRVARNAASTRQQCAAAILCILIALGVALPAHAARVVVLQLSDTERLSKTLAALQRHAGGPVDTIRLTSASNEAWEAALAKGERPAVIVALGPLASDFIARLPAGPPVVHCLAGADALRAGGSSLPSEVPAEMQAYWLRKLVPTAKTVGLAFDPINAQRAEAIAASLGAAGYKTLMTPVAAPSAIPAALDRIAARADVLLALPDQTVYTRESARGILLQSFRRKTPVIGPSDAWVRLGALYALDWDYDEIGAACGQLAAREVQGARSSVPLPPPPKPRVSVNLRSAAQFGLHWDVELLRGVDIRHE